MKLGGRALGTLLPRLYYTPKVHCSAVFSLDVRPDSLL